MGASCQRSTILFGILAGIGVFVMISVGSIVVKEYTMAKSFQPTECRLQDVTELGNRSCQYCSTSSVSSRRRGRRSKRATRKCRPSSFPCVRMTVSFHDAFRDNRNATYFPDVIEMSESLLCSFFNCGPSFTSNEIQVRNRVKHFMDTHMHHPFTCFYSTLHPGRVIGRKIYSYESAFHGMLWPALITGIALIGVLTTMFNLHQRFRNKPAEVPPTVELAAIHGSRLSVIRNDDCSGGATGGSANQEKVPLTKPQRGAQVINPPQSNNASAPPPYLPPIGFTNSADTAYLPQQQGEGSDRMYPHHQAPYPTPNNDGAMHPSPPYTGTDTMYPPPLQTDSSPPSAPPPSYNSVFNR